MLSDKIREHRISLAQRALVAAKTPESRRAAWSLMASLIKQRSGSQVARMEKKAGLV